MNKEDRNTYIRSQVACAIIEALGMAASNSQHPQDQPFNVDDFNGLHMKYGIHHNAVIGYLQD